MSDLSDAFTELQSAFDGATGKAQKCKVAGKSYSAIIEELTLDEVMASGGEAEAGGFRVMIATADMKKKPASGVEIEVRGETMEVLSCVNTNGVTWTIVAGSLANE